MDMKKPETYAVRHKNELVRVASRSGGVFTAISDWILNNNGIVYGCALDKNFMAGHIRADNTELRNRMRGSKYVQSNLGHTFCNVKADLIAGKKVLFSGTSCQVAGLRKFLGNEYSNLYCVDIVCHGVPSPLIWEVYLKWQEERMQSKIISVDFRNKKEYGWREHIESLYFDNGEVINSRIFTELFYGHHILRPCCYECPYKSIIHPGDITIADYWGIENVAPEFDDNKGVSLVLVNNESGKKIFEFIKEEIKWKVTKLEDSLQPPLIAPYQAPKDRSIFWRKFEKKKFGYIVKKYGGTSIISTFVRKIKIIKRKLLG